MQTLSTFATHKARILKLTKGSIINLQVAKDKAGLRLISTVSDCEAVLKVLEKPRRVAPPVPGWVKQRYNETHKLWITKECPAAIRDHGWQPPIFPKVHTGNGLNNFIENFITWSGFRATRINVSGRKLNGKYIKSATRPGSADVSSTINGSVMWETKIGADKPSDKQLKEQAREIAAGGQYHFVKTAEQFLNIFDGILYG